MSQWSAVGGVSNVAPTAFLGSSMRSANALGLGSNPSFMDHLVSSLRDLTSPFPFTDGLGLSGAISGGQSVQSFSSQAVANAVVANEISGHSGR
jgi:hypothetical protein